MKKSLLVLALIAIMPSAFAQQFVAQVQQADCTLVAKAGSTAGAMIGGSLGAAAGSAIGGAIFGKGWGKALGGLAGGAGGAIAGENIGSTKTYSCIIKVISPSGDVLYGRTTNTRLYVVGEQVSVTQTKNEIFIQ